MTSIDIKHWMTQRLANDPPRAKSLVMTIFGDAIVPHGGRLWLGSLIALAAPLGLTERLVRTSVFRLVQEGWLVATRDGRRSSYALPPAARPRFERANQRIYASPARDWDGQWTLLLAPVSIDATLRAALRRELAWEGFGQVAAGVLAHPSCGADDLAEILARVDGAAALVACRAQALPGSAARTLDELVEAGWDLAGVLAGYRAFIEDHSALAAALRDGARLAPADAFALRTLLMHAYRRVQLQDPMLPLALLPDPWPGVQAWELAQAVYRRLCAPAEEHLMEVLRSEDDAAPAADAAFHARFGGLG